MTKEAKLDSVVRTALARAITTCEVPDDVVSVVSDRLVTLADVDRIRRFDVCTHGICIDYFVDRERSTDILKKLFELDVPIKKVEGFPWGVLPFLEDLVQVHVEVEVEELAGRIG